METKELNGMFELKHSGRGRVFIYRNDFAQGAELRAKTQELANLANLHEALKRSIELEVKLALKKTLPANFQVEKIILHGYENSNISFECRCVGLSVFRPPLMQAATGSLKRFCTMVADKFESLWG